MLGKIGKEPTMGCRSFTDLTAHLERFNNIIRQRLARFVRQTLSFSKSEPINLICLHLSLVRYSLDIKAGNLG
jgi:IS1 family transposase